MEWRVGWPSILMFWVAASRVVAQEAPMDPEAPKPDPRLIVQAIEGEPAWPAPGEDAGIRKIGGVPFAGGYLWELRDKDGRRRAGVVTSGIILLDRGLVELFACGDGGKEHETIVKLQCDIQALDLAFVLCGLRRGGLPKKLGEPDSNQGSRVVALVQWMAGDGKPVTHRAEDLVASVRRSAPMPRIGWTYVGRWREVPDLASATPKTSPILAASKTRSLVTTFRDESTLLDNPLDEAVDDTLFMANHMVLPRPGTRVRVMFRAPSPDEVKQISGLEKEPPK